MFQFVKYLLVLLPIFSIAQNSFQEIVQEGEGDISILYRPTGQFMTVNDGGVLGGFEYELINHFVKWVENNYEVSINVNFKEADSFNGLYKSVREDTTKGVFGTCSFSITEKRLEEVRFSPAYMPDIEVMVTSLDLPVLKDTADFPKYFKNAQALTVAGSTFEQDVEMLKSNYSFVEKTYLESGDDVLKYIQTNANCYGFVELPSYFSNNATGTVNRQNLFIIQRNGYGFIYSKKSDWNGVVWAYFQEEENKLKVNEIMQKYFGSQLISFLNELDASSIDQQMVLILGKEKEIEEVKNKNLQLQNENEKLAIEKKAADDIAGQKVIRNYLIIGLFALLLIAGMFLYAYFNKKRDNAIIIKQKEEVTKQKEVIEEKHRLITDSIHYAKTIQNAMLQGEEHINPDLPDHFVFFSPKDVVSGDFYWSKIVGEYCYFAAVDCTGHGVPGGFMSVLGISLLNDILFDHEFLSPAEVLEKLNKRVIIELDQSAQEGSSRDGMDISLSRINLKTLELAWSGAYNPLYIFRSGILSELRADKQPIGFYEYRKPFTNHKFQLEKGDMIYSSTDGYPDQFGGPKNKKFKSKGFRNLLKEIQVLSTKEQKKFLERHFKDWKGDNEQVDDACVIGMRI